MTTAREEMLKRVRAHVRRHEAHPPARRTDRQFDDLVVRFDEALTGVGGEVLRAESLAAAWDQLGDLLQALGAAHVVANDEPPFSGMDLEQRWQDVEWYVVGRTAGDLRAFCAAADVGLSGADAALAETGSIVISSGPGKSRLATLLPPVHVALVPTDRLTTDLFTWTAARQGAMPSNLTLVSGPSKTGDIEQILAVGVHGPKRFVVILYEA